jgi:hypothetical protein
MWSPQPCRIKDYGCPITRIAASSCVWIHACVILLPTIVLYSYGNTSLYIIPNNKISD